MIADKALCISRNVRVSFMLSAFLSDFLLSSVVIVLSNLFFKEVDEIPSVYGISINSPPHSLKTLITFFLVSF